MARGRVEGLGTTGEGLVITAEGLRQAAEAIAADKAAERTAMRSRLDAAAARAAHDLETARSQLDHLQASRRALVDGAQWALDTERDLPAHVQAIDEARVALEARQADQRAARQSLERVLEQRAAASAAIQAADGELGELDSASMDENDLRRELEAAGQAVRAAHEAHAAAVAKVQALGAEHDAVEHRCAQLRASLAAHDTDGIAAARLYDRVAAAFVEWTDAVADAQPDPYAQALADAFTDLLADLAELQGTVGPAVDEHTLERAQDALDQAARELQRLEAEAPPAALTPADRAELDAAHTAVDAAAARCDRPLGKAAALRRLEEAKAAERALLDRFGFGSYLEVVLTGGRTATTTPERLAAERAFVNAQALRDRLQTAQRSTPELDHLRSEHERLLAHAVDRLGVDPGEAVVDLLRAHPRVPGPVVEGLRAALSAVGVDPVGRSLVDVADEWLRAHADASAAQRAEHATVDALQSDLEALVARAGGLSTALADARHEESVAAEQLELATRSVGAVEAELTSRVGEDSSRLQRFVAAEQLRTQVEALGATLARAEEDARQQLDRANDGAAAAELAFDRAQGVVAELARHARALAEELPIDQRPTGDRLATLASLAGLLRSHAEVVRPVIDAAEVAVTLAAAKVDDACAAAEAAGTGTDGPRPDDVAEGLGSLLDTADRLIVLDEPFTSVGPDLRPRLLDLVLAHRSPIVLLTDDADVLGWAIGLPADQATVVTADSLLNLLPRSADTNTAALSAPTPRPPARLSAGQR